MTHSTFNNRLHALESALREDHEPGSHPAAILPAEHIQALNLIRLLTAGGWHLIHADDLPAGYAPGDAIQGARTSEQTLSDDIREKHEQRLNRHRHELDYALGESPTLYPDRSRDYCGDRNYPTPDDYHDDDQRLGGHDNPHPTNT